jgi:hypothetical protein
MRLRRRANACYRSLRALPIVYGWLSFGKSADFQMRIANQGGKS